MGAIPCEPARMLCEQEGLWNPRKNAVFPLRQRIRRRTRFASPREHTGFAIPLQNGIRSNGKRTYKGGLGNQAAFFILTPLPKESPRESHRVRW